MTRQEEVRAKGAEEQVVMMSLEDEVGSKVTREGRGCASLCPSLVTCAAYKSSARATCSCIFKNSMSALFHAFRTAHTCPRRWSQGWSRTMAVVRRPDGAQHSW